MWNFDLHEGDCWVLVEACALCHFSFMVLFFLLLINKLCFNLHELCVTNIQ